MASQALIAVSPDGRYVAAQVQHLLTVVEQSTGASVQLPAPVFTLVDDVAGDADGAEEGGEEDGDAGEGGEEEEGEGEDKKARPAKKAKHAAAGAAAADTSSKDASATGKAAAAVGQGQRSHEGAKPIRVLAFHPDPAAPWFMYNSAEKYIHLYHRSDTYESGFKHILTVVVPRKVQQAIFHPLRFSPSSSGLSVPQLIVADKTGDISLLHGLDLSVLSLQLGHLAALTHMHFYLAPGSRVHAANPNTQPTDTPRNYLLTSDSDAKIRVSNSPNFFDIQAYCLGHPAFVSTFAVLSLSTPLVVSGGLGAELVLWNLATGSKLGGVNLAAHRPGHEGVAVAVAAEGGDALPAGVDNTSSSTEITERAAAQQCYVSNISVAETADGIFTLAVSVYPWPYVFMLQYAPGRASHFSVTSTLKFDSPPQVVLLAPATGGAQVSVEAAAAASVPVRGVEARLWVLDQSFGLHARRRGRECGQWKDATITGSAHDQKAVTSLVGVCANAFLEATASLADTLITDKNAAEFIGAGSEVTKAAAAAAAPAAAGGDEKAAGGDAATGTPPGRYVSPFSSTAVASGHLGRLALLTPAGFAFRRFFDKMARDKYVSAKRAEAQKRRADNKQKRAENKAANARQKKVDEQAEMDD